MSATARFSRWPNEDVILLLSSLNLHIYKIQQELLEDEAHGMGWATERLSECFPDGCTPSRVARKIKAIWQLKGAEGSKLVDLYRHGACPRTLPHLDPAMLMSIAKAVRRTQNSRPTDHNKGLALGEGEKLRRSERMELAKKSIDEDPIECRCAFTHYGSSCIHCDGCATWQHIFCYYGNDTENPESHLCDVCTGVKVNCAYPAGSCVSQSMLEGFVQSMQRLNVNTDDAQCRPRPASQTILFLDDHKLDGRCQENFELPRDDEELWGLDDSEIIRPLRFIGYHIRDIVNSLETHHGHAPGVQSSCLEATGDLRDLVGIVFRDIPEKHFASLLQKISMEPEFEASLLRALISAAVQQWVFYSPDSEVASIKTACYDRQQQVIVEKYGLRTLRNIHRATWASHTYAKQIRAIHASNSESLTKRLLEALHPLIVAAETGKDMSVGKNRPTSVEDDEARMRAISLIFAASLKLKALLPTTEQYYELLAPGFGSSFSRRTTEIEGEEITEVDITDGSKVQFCIMPGIIEYPTSASSGTLGSLQDLFGPHNFVRATAAERDGGRIICRAIVTLQEAITADGSGETVGSWEL